VDAVNGRKSVVYVLLLSITGELSRAARDVRYHWERQTEWPQVGQMLGQDAVSTSSVTWNQALHVDSKDWPL